MCIWEMLYGDVDVGADVCVDVDNITKAELALVEKSLHDFRGGCVILT